MSIRVYALAKELNVDKNDLMNLCSNLNIGTKGNSALACISDADAIKVKEYLAKGAGTSPRKANRSENTAPLEPPKNIVTGRVPTLPSKPRRTEKKETAKVERVEEDSASVVPAVAESDVKAEISENSVSSSVVVEEKESKKSESAQSKNNVQDSVLSETPAAEIEKGATKAVKVKVEAGEEDTVKESVKVEASSDVKVMDSASKTENETANTQEVAEVPAVDIPETKTSPVSEEKVVVELTEKSEEKVTETESGKSDKETAGSDVEKVTEKETDKSEKIAEKTVVKSGEKSSEKASTKERSGKEGRKNKEKEGGRGERRKGNGPLSKKMRASENQSRTPVLSVAEKIAMEAQTGVPVRPTFDNSFPTLQSARTTRHEEAGKTGSNSHREDRRSPGLRLAPVPQAKTPAPKKQEPAGMVPQVRLTPEEIRAMMAGNTDAIMRKVEDVQNRNAKENAREDRQRGNKDKGGKEKGSGNGQERSNDKKNRRNNNSNNGNNQQQSENRSSRAQQVAQQQMPMEEGSSKFGAKKSGNKSGRKETSGRRGSGMGDGGESLHSPSRDSRFGATDKRAKGRRITMDDDDYEHSMSHFRNGKKQKGTSGAGVTAPRKSSYVLQLPLTVRSFAEGVGLTAAKVLGKLMMEFGLPSTITSPLDETTAQLLAESFGIPVDIRPEVTLEERLIGDAEEDHDNEEDLVSRPPVVTFLGHVDHGKTSLLDKIININVVSGEKGGITQHIRAYNVKYQDKSVTFVDTPGHEAFTEMRARGANTTDIAVIVVAADDGVMPQTEEAISHARAAGVPIIVALNKIDLPGVNEMRILQELATNELTPSEWGGDVEVVRCSALTGEGIDSLMETILMVAELQEFRANPKRQAKGVCIESLIQQGRGVVAKLLVQNGTLHTGDVVVCGSSYGRIKAMVDTLDSHVKYQEAGPAIPVSVLGLDTAPGAGDKFYVLDDIADARRLAEERAEQEHLSQLAGSTKTHVTLEGLFDSLGSKEVKTLNIILRTDVRGSIEAIRKELGKLEHEEVQIAILQASVGGVTEADVQLADASDAIIIGFNVVPDENARVLAERKGVQVRRYDIIYQLTADVRAALEGMLTPEEHEKELGRALVQQVFQISKVGAVAGCRVISGTIPRDCKIRIIRNNRVIGAYALDTLKREKDDVKEVRDGYECGMRLAGYNDIKEGDVFEAFQIESVARTF
ncbi:MAG: translation initiation factor IF-2 [Planctomycetia bacterium]|nr:translation initiation factor IF-2 [Planctomycetia bacterium]